MRSSDNRSQYSLYKKQTKSGFVWYVRFWDYKSQKYSVVRSTGIKVEGKKERWREADDAAKGLLEELRKQEAEQETTCLKSNIVNIAHGEQDSENVLSVTTNNSNQSFIQYLLDFWTADSEYANYKRGVKKRPLSAYYVQMNHDDVLRHIATFPDFQNITIEDVNRKLLKKWLIWMSAKKVVYMKKDGTKVEGDFLSGRRINSVLQCMRVAVRWAVDNEELQIDPFRNLDEAAEVSKEKGILTQHELNRLIATPTVDPFSRLAVLLASRCGMRLGEVRGLKWGDIKVENGIIIIQHNYVNLDGLKSPKIKGGTIVKNSSPVPLPSDLEDALNNVKQYSNFTSGDDFVMQSFRRKGSVISKEYFRKALRRELQSIGIDERTQKERNLTFHGLRHTYITLGRLSGLNDLEMQTLGRHKSISMMERYSHGKQAIDFIEARKKLEQSVKENVI
jgi:integrase